MAAETPKPNIKQNIKPKVEIIKSYEKRFLFLIPGGQDLMSESLKFTYVEINDKLAQFVSNDIWKSEAA